MSLDEIILIFAAFIIIGLILVVMASLLISLKNKKNQQDYIQSKHTDELSFDDYLPKYFANESNVIKIDYDKSQMELPFQSRTTNIAAKEKDEEFHRYTQSRQRYTVINPPAINIRKVSNFY